MGNLLDEIHDKLNKLLDNDLAICQHYSSIVIILYKNILLHLNGVMDINCFRDDINELISYIEKENDSFKKLLSYDKATLFSKINYHIEKEDSPPEYLRFIEKLRFMKNIFEGFKISAGQLYIDNIPSDVQFDIYSAIFSVIYIETFKKILNKLESLSYDVESDKLFIDSLFGELNSKIIYRCSCNDLFEMICLYNNIEINRFPDMSMDILKRVLSNIYNQLNVDAHINEILYNSVIEDILKIRIKCYLINNPEDVFEYLYFTMKTNVIMSYLNKEYLLKLLEFCNNNDFCNDFICEDVKKLIKARLND